MQYDEILSMLNGLIDTVTKAQTREELEFVRNFISANAYDINEILDSHTFKVWVEVEELDHRGEPVENSRGELSMGLDGADVGTFDSKDDAIAFANRLQTLGQLARSQRPPKPSKVVVDAEAGSDEFLIVCVEHGERLDRWFEEGYASKRYLEDVHEDIDKYSGEAHYSAALTYSSMEGEGDGDQESYDCGKCGTCGWPPNVDLDYK